MTTEVKVTRVPGGPDFAVKAVPVGVDVDGNRYTNQHEVVELKEGETHTFTLHDGRELRVYEKS